MAGEPIITIVGNLTADPDLRYVSSGIAVASFTVASTPRNLNKQTQQWEDGEPMFVRCSVWRDYADNVTESLTKGTRVVVTGRLQVRSYETKEGERRTSIEMQVDEIGPSLRYATAQVTKATRGGGQNSGGYGQAQRGGNVSYDAPPGGSGQDPWNSGGSSYDDNPPF